MILVVLIVPYGIETTKVNMSLTDEAVLIVPYGIETEVRYVELPVKNVLIVPYGIETRYVIYIQAAIMVC